MTLAWAPFGEPVTVLRRTVVGENDFGNDVIEYVEAETWPRCAVYPKDPNGQVANERLNWRDEAEFGLMALLPERSAITAYDRVLVRGEVWEVNGPPNLQRHSFTGWRPGVLVPLRRVEG